MIGIVSFAKGISRKDQDILEKIPKNGESLSYHVENVFIKCRENRKQSPQMQ